MDRTITVTGAGTAFAAPDRVRIEGSISGKRSDYAQATAAAADSVRDLKKAVGDAGFDMDMVRTTRFSVRADYRSVEENGERRNVFDGFVFNHGITFSIDAADDSLGRVLQAMFECENAPQFNVSYYVSDPSKPMASAREAAVKDARHKAKALAESAGVRLGQIVLINYASSCCEGSNMALMCGRSMGADITPQDERFDDSVTVSWSITE